jgi:hypothetical protein
LNARDAAALCAALVLAGIAGCPGEAGEADADAAASTEMIARYVGGWDVDALLGEPPIAAELHALLGDSLKQLEFNLDVTAGVEYYGGALTVSGNAPHLGTEQEAVVCVQPLAVPRVHAAIYSRGAITVYTREARYEYLPTCVKDWITLVNSGHVDRMEQPGNVSLVRMP